MFIEKSRQSGVVAVNKFLECWRRISNQRWIGNIIGEKINVSRLDMTEWMENWSFLRWRLKLYWRQHEEMIRWWGSRGINNWRKTGLTGSYEEIQCIVTVVRGSDDMLLKVWRCQEREKLDCMTIFSIVDMNVKITSDDEFVWQGDNWRQKWTEIRNKCWEWLGMRRVGWPVNVEYREF